MDRLRLSPPRAKAATLSLPGDKSISHRAFMLAAISPGRTRIIAPNAGEDVLATIRALRQLGVGVSRTQRGFSVRGVREFRSPGRLIDCANSGTTMRLLAGLLAGRVAATLDGDASLRRRPMSRVAEPLNRMGADIRSAARGLPPLRIHPSDQLHGSRVRVTVPSAQIKSAILLAALHARGQTTLTLDHLTRDHTERMLRDFGADLRVRGKTITLRPCALRSPGELEIFGDLSAAIYFACAAAVLPGARLRLRKVGVNPTRSAIVDILLAMGVRMTVKPLRTSGSEPAADLIISGGAPLRCVPVRSAVVPEIIDEIPALCALAANASGVLRIGGATELRYKESNRIETTVALLRRFGVQAQALRDGIVVQGGQPLRAPATVESEGDHRIALAAAILAAAAGSEITIVDSACIATSFPGFARAWRTAFG